MTRPCLEFVSALTILSSGACSSPLEPIACPVTSEWGTEGCAQVIVIVDEPTSTTIGSGALYVTARSMDGRSISHAPSPVFGTFRMLVDLGPFPQVDASEPLSAWIVAYVVGPPSEDPILASDSVLATLRFVGAGVVPQLDTVRLRPH